MHAFHRLIADWFQRRFASATPSQLEAWPHIEAGDDVLVSAPTGSGKTLAAGRRRRSRSGAAKRRGVRPSCPKRSRACGKTSRRGRTLTTFAGWPTTVVSIGLAPSRRPHMYVPVLLAWARSRLVTAWSRNDSSMRVGACSSFCTLRSALGSTGLGGSRFGNASAARSTSSSRRRPPTTGS
ncbi:MAG TPA: DEAD/DEAH box helicase [Acidobacteria bacterium]|nr:DEAD/DEAH box helicase [Acidobacteriota bacterium]